MDVNWAGDAERRGPMSPDPLLDPWRLPPSDRCWWCGAPATTMEHRIKHSTLRRVARDEQGILDPRNVFKKADDYEGSLRSLKKGTQVKWLKNMCATCNNARSQPFDLAYDRMESFIIKYADTLMTWPRLRWQQVYGDDWERGAADLARYFAKQVCCMLATQRLPIPDDLIAFLDGAPRCPSVAFAIYRDWRKGDMHKIMCRDGFEDGIMSLVGLLPALAWQSEGEFAGVDYGYYIGYVQFVAYWRRASNRVSWWESSEIDLPLVSGDLTSRVSWWMGHARRRFSARFKDKSSHAGSPCSRLRMGRSTNWVRRSIPQSGDQEN